MRVIFFDAGRKTRMLFFLTAGCESSNVKQKGLGIPRQTLASQGIRSFGYPKHAYSDRLDSFSSFLFKVDSAFFASLHSIALNCSE